MEPWPLIWEAESPGLSSDIGCGAKGVVDVVDGLVKVGGRCCSVVGGGGPCCAAAGTAAALAFCCAMRSRWRRVKKRYRKNETIALTMRKIDPITIPAMAPPLSPELPEEELAVGVEVVVSPPNGVVAGGPIEVGPMTTLESAPATLLVGLAPLTASILKES